MKELQAITDRLGQRKKDSPVSPPSDLELCMAYIATLHSRIEDLETSAPNLHGRMLISGAPAYNRPVDFEVQTHEDTLRAQYVAATDIIDSFDVDARADSRLNFYTLNNLPLPGGGERIFQIISPAPEGDILHLLYNAAPLPFAGEAYAEDPLLEGLGQLREQWLNENKLVDE